ncbi:hypothetical protein SBA1_1040042 [Candidatus Sulfotelmatobacter kueseliae]|uniref:Uncharacterized protein n=1 Tax=Candidatus Sulfotelmatobacter kueseliae TaxID=2042962 RepID=A0A2U3JXW4_9BACT|nr:hypothetical protein SBA1_1040042 [Candidatus Sulfotelmatobacter kueseliae]
MSKQLARCLVIGRCFALSALWVLHFRLLYRKYNKYGMYYTIAICIVHSPIAKLYFRGGENRFFGIPSEPTTAARHSADC